MKKLVLIPVLVLMGTLGVFSQYDLDALRFSQNIYQSDARSMGVGNAMGAVGANYFSSVINPAGLAFFRTGEYIMSVGFSGTTTLSSYLSNTNKTTRNQLTIPSMAFVFPTINTSDGKPVTDGWVSNTFAFGLNRTNAYIGRSFYSGRNTESSILDFFTESAKGKSPSQLGTVTGLAYDTYLIDDPDGDRNYISALGDSFNSYKMDQSKTFASRGSAYDMNIAYAANYSNLVFIGAKIGIPFLDYVSSGKFFENNLSSSPSNYLSTDYESELDLSGVGFNAGLGIIIRPIKYLRVGGSIVSPTFYRMTENYNEKMISELDTHTYDPKILEGSYNYNLTTPFKATASIAVIAGEYGFISLDYEYIDYSSAVLSANDDPFSYENRNIADLYQSASNIRVGGELKLGIFALRAGYGLNQSPYKEIYRPEKGDRSSTVYSGGIGIREKTYYIDFAWQRILMNEYEVPYILSSKNVEGANKENITTNVVATFGFRF